MVCEWWLLPTVVVLLFLLCLALAWLAERVIPDFWKGSWSDDEREE